MQKTIFCKYCGQKTAVGSPIVMEQSAYRVVRGASRMLGTISAVMTGRPYSAYMHATGKSEDAVLKTTNNTIGGGWYHFVCQNPDCEQEFDQQVLQ